jgi:hypothetical protein
MLACRRRAALLILLSLAGSMVSVGAALGRDERWAERVTADDDPILIPRFAMPHSLDGTPARASPIRRRAGLAQPHSAPPTA